MDLKKLFGEEYIETTIDNLHKQGHTKTNLKNALSCVAYIFENASDDFIEKNINLPRDNFFAHSYTHIAEKKYLFSIPCFERILMAEFNYQNLMVKKPKFSPNDTFLELSRVLFAQKKQLKK